MVGSLDDAAWRRVFELSSAHGLYWGVRFKYEHETVRYLEDKNSCYKACFEPIEAHRIGPRAIADGDGGPFWYSDLVWVRFPRRILAGWCMRVRSDIEFDLARIEALVKAQVDIPYTVTSDYVHIGDSDT
jgi:hypothetical protein